ncbi:MAG: alanine racemase [Planctomycetes bacterium]|nr:alanine racemase [Planctomycetota bacterium]
MKKYRVWAEIDLKTLAENVRHIRSQLAKSQGDGVPTMPCRHGVANVGSTDGVKILVVVKADAYGHGAVPVSKTALESGAYMLGVGDSTEAIELRQSGILNPILILGALIEEEISWIVSYDITPSIHSMDLVSIINDEAKRQNKRFKVHLKIDTGMSRLGATPKRAIEIARKIATLPNIELEGISSHFSSTADPKNSDFTSQQLKLFKETVDEIEKVTGLNIPLKHIANTGAIYTHPDSYFSMVRPGGIIYGVDPGKVATSPVTPCRYDVALMRDKVSQNKIAFNPILSLKSQVAFIKIVPPKTPVGYWRSYITPKRTKIATVPVGYNDGYPYHLSNKGYALVRGQKVPVIGTVTMDYLMFDVTGVPDVKVGDEVVLIGKQGDQKITTEELAQITGTSPYVITCGLGKRVRRVYLG